MNALEKAEAYDKAVEKARQEYNTTENVERKQWLEELFPQLRENKDEKFRKYILKCCEETIQANDRGLELSMDTTKKLKNWLEKKDQKETTWNQEDEENMNNILYILNQLKDISYSYKEDDLAENAINWFKSLKDRLCSNNEYDEDMSGAIEYCIKNKRPLEKEHVAWLVKQGNKQTYQSNERAWLYLVADVLTWREGIGQYLDDPRVQKLANKLQKEYSQKLYVEKQVKQKPTWTDNDRIMAFTLLRDVDQMTYISKEGKNERLEWLNSLEDRFKNE